MTGTGDRRGGVTTPGLKRGVGCAGRETSASRPRAGTAGSDRGVAVRWEFPWLISFWSALRTYKTSATLTARIPTIASTHSDGFRANILLILRLFACLLCRENS